jgi:hypothetical protein
MMPTTDKNGREILPGDTLKLYHFTGARRKKHFMYKFVKEIIHGKTAAFFSILHLDLAGGSYVMMDDGKRHDDIEIVQGFGTDGVVFDQRLRA